MDVNVLVALAHEDHVHHAPARRWFTQRGHIAFATCPIVQSGFVRVATNPRSFKGRLTFEEAGIFLHGLSRMPEHEFWPDDLDWTSPGTLRWQRLRGHLQTTDLYLVSLAESHNGMFATFDRGPSELASRRDFVEVIPTA